MTGLDFSSATFGTANMAYQAGIQTPPNAGIPIGGSPAKAAALKKAAQDFEAMFMSSMLESMTAGVKPNKLFGGGNGEQMYRSMLNQEYGKAIAATGSIGIADSIEREMLRMQEQSQK
jgi:Rod binding domain-containing protein